MAVTVLGEHQKRLWKLFAAALGLLLLGVGFLSGFFTAKHIGTNHLARCFASHAGSPGPDDAVGQAIPFTRGMPVEGLALRQLPPPWSEEAQQLQDMPGMSDTASLYTFYKDAQQITEKLTAAFLHQLQLQLDVSNHNTTEKARFKQVMNQFREVSRDILSYLRHHNSQSLLLLLRQYAQQRSFTMADIDPDQLQVEVKRLLDLNELGRWYARMARKDHPSYTTRPVVGLQSNQGTSELLQGSSAGHSSSDSNRHLLAAGEATARQLLWQHGRDPARSLHAAPAPGPAATLAGAPIPVIPRETATASRIPPTVSPLMTMQEMLCSVQDFSPTKLQGMLLPNMKNKAAQGTSITCTPPREPKPFRYQQLAFKPVKIPVVFHCQRFKLDGVELPPMWRAEEAAANLIKVANKAYERALIQFELQEVRYDSKKFPYLLLGSVKDWQDCTGNPSQEAAGFPCLAQTAEFDDVAALTKKYVINIIVGGSNFPAWCNGTKEEACSSVYAGYSGAIGPWFSRPSATWSETAAPENWVFISWDEFSPMSRNSKRFWDGGGVTVAHELGHYLGLMHTHEGTGPCEGDGLTKADFVPDTPVNLQTIQWASTNGLAVQLSRWCTQFRTGKKPNPKELLVFNSCAQDPLAIDNVFNILSYLPDQCCMLLTPNQIARMQWAIARFRPKLMAAHAIKQR